MKSLILVVIAVLVAPAALAADSTPVAKPRITAPDRALALAPAQGTEACIGAPLMRVLAALHEGPTLRIRRAADRVTVEDRVRERVLLAADCDGLAVSGPVDARLPSGDAGATTEVVRDVQGAVVYSHSVTPLGARVTLIAPSATNRAGLDLTAFDNDDVYVADAFGRLVLQRHTTADGALVVREDAVVGCGCEQVTSPDGRVAVKPL